jgi:hypothetical protein
MSLLTAVDPVQITAIATEVFAAMVDRQSGLLTAWEGARPIVGDPVYAWVDLDTDGASRILLTTDASTADDLTRAFLSMDASEAVAQADMADAFGEIANVFGGNIKALLPEHVGLTLPQVSTRSPSVAGGVQLHEVALSWRGRPLVITLSLI